MITTLTGENDFALHQALHQLISAFTSEYGQLTMQRIDGEEVDPEALQETLTALPFLASRQLVILRTPNKNKYFSQQFEQLLTSSPETTDVIIIEPKLDKRLSYYKFLKNQTDFQEFPILNQDALVQWLMATATANHGSLQSDTARYLVNRIGNNQELLSHELDKLVLYSSQITPQTIDLLTDPTPQSTVFQLLEAAFSGQHKKTIQLYNEQRALKVEPQQIIALLAWQLHVFTIIKTAGDRSVDQVGREAQINPYVLRKSLNLTRRLDLLALKRLITHLTTLDMRIKRASINPDEALQYYLLGLST